MVVMVKTPSDMEGVYYFTNGYLTITILATNIVSN